jgi:polysaccharide export outer membrane protein
MSLAGCAGGGDPTTAPLSVSPQRSGAGSLGAAYRIGAADKVKVTVFGEPDLSGSFELSSEGSLTLPLIGTLPAQGRTLDELRADLTRRLSSGYLRNPKITLEIADYRPVYVHGEVRSGGAFPFKHGMTMRDVIARAGGYTYRAATGYLLVTRNGAGDELRVDLPSDAPVQPGDNIRVPERLF